MQARRVLTAICVLVAGVVGASSASDVPLTSPKSGAKFKDAPGTASDSARIKWVKDPALVGLENPTCPATSAVEISTSNQGTGTIPLDCGLWFARGGGYSTRI